MEYVTIQMEKAKRLLGQPAILGKLPMLHRLSKSRFMAGLHCERRLWLLVNRRILRKMGPSVIEAACFALVFSD